jgi:RNA polymerase sigma-70 factor, ECF subfamily
MGTRGIFEGSSILLMCGGGYWIRRGGEASLNESDVALIRAAMSGRSESFSTLVTHYRNFVYRTVYGILRNAADAEDVTQETFIKVYQSLKGLRQPETFPTWLARTAVRTALNWVEKSNRSRAAPLEGNIGYVQRDEYRSTQIRIDVENALNQLSPEHRAVIVLRELHGFNYEEMARILEVPVGTVRSRLFNARTKLRQLLSDERGDA